MNNSVKLILNDNKKNCRKYFLNENVNDCSMELKLVLGEGMCIRYYDTEIINTLVYNTSC